MKSKIISNPPGSYELALHLGNYIAKIANESIKSRNRFLLAVSGGSLPVALAAALKAVYETGVELSTEKWYILYADERLVEEGHGDSNHKALESSVYILPFWKASKENIFQINYDLISDPIKCAAEYESRIHTFFNNDKESIDLVLLGMGPDGHTASLFPDHPLLNETKLLIAPITDSPKPPSCRITFTLPLLQLAMSIAFVAYGAGKAEMLQRVIKETEDEYNTTNSSKSDTRLPSSRVTSANGIVSWFVCNDAARLLD